MKQLFFAVILFVGPMCGAQERHRFEIETQTGYEYNYFKSPDQVSVDGTLLTANDLIASSAYQDVYADYDYRYKWKGHRIRVSMAPFVRLFQENMQDSYWGVDAALKYDYKCTKTTKVLAALDFKRMDREGLDGAQDVLVNPLGYTNYGAMAGLGFEPFTNNKTVLEGFYNFKDFDAYGTRDLEFNEFGIQLGSKQAFRPGRYQHNVGFTAYYKKRRYNTLNTEEDPQNGTRNWDYAKGTVFYELPLSATLEVEPQLAYFGRFDRLEDRSGFHQYGPGLRFRFDNDKTKVSVSLKYQIRDYTAIAAQDDLGALEEKLRYQYTDISINFEQESGIEGLLLTGTIYSRWRETNTTALGSRSFRGYRNYYAGVGVKWQL
ncbi:MAG: hypothetical protein AAGB24_06350 [Bacteroidota bacterium]